uniref:hypothetical protein n=1 Tax=Yersinia mollaretii TaxID=33060 RepID=UPI0016439DA4
DWDYTLNNYYGFLNSDLQNDYKISITHALAKMALRIKSSQPDKYTTIFIEPLDDIEMERRIIDRDQNKNELKVRLQHGVDELVHKSLFDYSFNSNDSCDVAKKIIYLMDEQD